MDDILGLFDSVPEHLPDGEGVPHDSSHHMLGGMETYQTIPRLDGGATVYHDGHRVADMTPQLNGGMLIHTFDDGFHHSPFGHGGLGALDDSQHAQAVDEQDFAGVIALDDLATAPMHSDNLGALTIGDPYADAPYWHMQDDDYSCAVASQAGVLESLMHREVPESELATIAYEHGWYDPASGTPPEAVGNLLEYYGVPVDREYDTPLTDVFDALLRGDKVIVALNANEIWEPQTGPDGQPLELPVAGHAVWVTGMHQDDNGQWTVVLNDTGTPGGRQETVALPDFMNAWDDFGRYAVMTQTAEENPYVA